MKELGKKTNIELAKLLREKKQTLMTLRFNMSGAGAKDVREMRTLKKDVAKIMTELTARKIAENNK